MTVDGAATNFIRLSKFQNQEQQPIFKQLTINLGKRSYPIYIGSGLLDDHDLLRQHIRAKQIMIVSNETVAPLYLERVQAAFADFQCDTVILPDGEAHKDITSFMQIIDTLIDNQHHRNTTLVALGGGVIGDITGFASACYQRGTDFIQMPTTLLAQVDASVGGKTAINHPRAKNMIGAFHQPRCVIIDTQTLDTLPDRHISAGVAEIIKAALIHDATFFSWLENNMAKLLQKDPQAIAIAIERACAIKCEIVAQDETETTGTRALLNLGHTFGHAIEQNLNYQQWLHGEAVAAGTVMAADLSQQLGWLNETDVARIQKLIQAAKLPIRPPSGLQCESLLTAMAVDKKNVNANIRFVLLKAIGEAVLTDSVDATLLKQRLAYFSV